MRFISLSGDWYQIGFQHGRKLKEMIHYSVRKYCRYYKDKGRPSPEALQQRANSLETYFPDLVEEMRGIADGSQSTFNDILIYNLAPIPQACSNVAFLNGCQPMLGHVNDDIDGSRDVAFYMKPTHGMELLMVGIAGHVGAGAAINSGGLAMSHAAARSGGAVNNDAYLNLNLLRRLLIGNNSCCKDARHFLSTYDFASGADNIICIDSTGNGIIAEKLPTMVEFRKPVDRGIYCTGRAMTQTIRSAVQQDAYEKTAPEIASLVAREKLFAQTIAKDENIHSLNYMKQILQNTDEGIEVNNELSTWATILIPSKFEMWVADRFSYSDKFIRICCTSRYRYI
ncbi:MAG: C45 family autoproteolytic acyltransferase/hydrolase [Armatimonadota bacterium]